MYLRVLVISFLPLISLGESIAYGSIQFIVNVHHVVRFPPFVHEQFWYIHSCGRRNSFLVGRESSETETAALIDAGTKGPTAAEVAENEKKRKLFKVFKVEEEGIRETEKALEADYNKLTEEKRAIDAKRKPRMSITEINALSKITRYAYNSRGQIIRIWGDATYPVQYVFNVDK